MLAKKTVCFNDLIIQRKYNMNTNKKGTITELQVMLAAVQFGCIVSIPYGNNDKYDQLWDINGNFLRVQVKTAREKKASGIGFIFNCYSVSNGERSKYSKENIDYFATYWNNCCYLIPVEECSTEKTLWIELSSNNFSNVCLAQNYTLEKVLSTIKANS